MVALFIVGVLVLCASFQRHCFIKVFLHNARHVATASLDCQLNLDRLSELAPYDVAIVVQLIEVLHFEVVVDLIIKDSLQLKALVLQHANVLLFLVVHI